MTGMATTYILGISAYYHDSAAVLLRDGVIARAAHEERFTRRKHDAAFPTEAVRWCLDAEGIDLSCLRHVVFYDKPFLKFERLLETYYGFAPAGLTSFLCSMPSWLKEKLFLRKVLEDELARACPGKPLATEVLFPEHHLSHAASAFYPSPFRSAAILTVDGVGEWTTAMLGFGEDAAITSLAELPFPHSLGLLYSAFTLYLGFRVNSGEYKVMGLAPYGDSEAEQTRRFERVLREELAQVQPDGSVWLNQDYFDYAAGLRMTRDQRWERLFGLPPRTPESELEQSHMNLALALQRFTEEVMVAMAGEAKRLTGSSNLVLAGGVALNCVANSKILGSGLFEDLWIQPASGDAGGALGAALACWHLVLQQPRRLDGRGDAMAGAFLGPAFSREDLERTARRHQATGTYYEDFSALCEAVAGHLEQGKVVGWFQGALEWGPRALGNRSILADPRDPETQRVLNLKTKFRESFRPFAPAVLAEDCADYFSPGRASPYMLLVAEVAPELRRSLPEDFRGKSLKDRLYTPRSSLPAITHLDFTARLQTVHRETNPRFWGLLQAFKRRTGVGVLVNTSFNVRGEPIVCSPDDAYRCFMRTHMDYLVLGDTLFDKREQPPWPEPPPSVEDLKNTD